MSDLQRFKAAVLGGIVADAATMGLHWVYDQDDLAAMLKEKGREGEPEFFPPVNKFYTHPDGEFTPYGYELLGTLKALAAIGKPDGDAIAKFLAEFYQGQKAANHYLNHSSKSVMANVEAGKAFPETGDPTDHNANSFVKAPAVVALMGGTGFLASGLETVIKAQQTESSAVEAGLAGGLILEKVALGKSIADSVTWALSPESSVTQNVKEQLKAGLTHKDAPFSETVKTLGLSCKLPEALQNAVIASLKFPNFVDAVRANIVAAGDQGSRAVLIGALFAAEHGIECIPESWRAKTVFYAEAEQLVDQILAKRS